MSKPISTNGQAYLYKYVKEQLDYSDFTSGRVIMLSVFKVQQIILEENVALHRWLYREGHPNMLAKILNKGWAFLHSLGISPNYLVTLEVIGRKSGKMTSFPLVMTVMNGERYLVSMLGEETNWVRNIKATGGKAQLRHGSSEQVLLEEIDVRQRAPILKAYLQHAPGARPHLPISKDAPISVFEKIASKYPVFRLHWKISIAPGFLIVNEKVNQLPVDTA